MDKFWQDVADHVLAESFSEPAIVAPIEMSAILPIEKGYANALPNTAEGADVLILHKGRYKELSRSFIRKALRRLHPSFANEVFIVLTTSGSHLDGGDPHLGNLAEIIAWADGDEGTEVATLSAGRMAATYIGRNEVLTETAFGHLMVLVSSDRSITPHVIRDGYFDLSMSRFFQRSLKPGMVYVDVGANVGIYALLAAGCVGPTGRVIAIEANPRLARLLGDNIAMNGFQAQAQAVQVAAASMAGELTMFEFSRHEGSHTMVPSVAEYAVKHFAERVTQITVSAKPLTDILAEAGVDNADLIKIDVEGFEIDVIRGAFPFLLATRPDLVLEWHPSFMSADTASQLHEILTGELHYAVERIGSDGSSQAVSYSELMALDHADILLKPKVV